MSWDFRTDGIKDGNGVVEETGKGGGRRPQTGVYSGLGPRTRKRKPKDRET